MKTSYIYISIILIFTACNSLKTKNQKIELNTNTYIIVKLLENDISSNDMSISFNSKAGKISGNTGCNDYFGNYTHADNNNITFSKIGATKKYCPEITKKEKILLKTLPEITKMYKNSVDEISFKNSSDETIIIVKLQ